MNWRLKILIKILLHQLPLNYNFWQRVGLFRLGFMDNPEYAEKIFKLHISRVYKEKIPSGVTVLELGPGDSLATALIAHAYGVEKIYLVDSGDYANHDLNIYQKLAAYLNSLGLESVDIDNISTTSELLSLCNAVYLTEGLHSLEAIPDNSIDFSWSHSVLEHIRKNNFKNTFVEMKRIIKPAGMMSHNVDFMDHLGGALNNLRFSDSIWESDFFANSGFYTNRIRYSEMLAILQDLGFSVSESGYSSWPTLPTRQNSMASPFKEWDEADLLIRCCHFVLSSNC